MVICDHKGREYPSISDMCAHYGITRKLYNRRRKRGWSVEQALTAPVKWETVGKPVTDHLGNSFPSTSELCRHYGIARAAFDERIRSGWSLEDALTKPTRKKISREIKDHLGNEYPSIAKLCEAYGIRKDVYKFRIRSGWSVEDALTKPVSNKRKPEITTDHLGNTYPSENAMCKAYGISRNTYRGRIGTGWSVEDALTTPAGEPTKATDHLGKEYASENDMCKAYGIAPTTFRSRKRKGWSLERALTEPVQEIYDGKTVTDHLGKEYHSIPELCRQYGISTNSYYNRLAAGWSLEKTLTTPVRKKSKERAEERQLDKDLRKVIRESGLSYEEVVELIRSSTAAADTATD